MRTTDGLISAATSAIASESASPARAGAMGDVTVCSRSRVVDMSNVSALFSLALALADSDCNLAWLSTAGNAEGIALATAAACWLPLRLLALTDRRTINGQDDIAEHQPGCVRGTAGFDGYDEQPQFLLIIEGAS